MCGCMAQVVTQSGTKGKNKRVADDASSEEVDTFTGATTSMTNEGTEKVSEQKQPAKKAKTSVETVSRVNISDAFFSYDTLHLLSAQQCLGRANRR